MQRHVRGLAQEAGADAWTYLFTGRRRVPVQCSEQRFTRQERVTDRTAGASGSKGTSSSPADSETGRSRPALVLILWAVTLLALAGLAPVAQASLGVPVELLSLVMLAPGLACAVVLVKPSWMPKPWERERGVSVLLTAVVAVVAVAVFFGMLALLTGSRPDWPTDIGGAPLAVFLLLQAAGALSEEVGWRGVVQRCGESFGHPAAVSAIAGFLFGATHLGYWGLGIIPVLTFALTAMLMSLTITTIFTGSFWQRMIPALIVHLGLNLSITCLSNNGEPIGTSASALGAAAAMFAAVAVAKALLSRRHQSR